VLAERDFARVLASLEEGAETEQVASASCASCGALVEPPPAGDAFPCPYCGSSIVATAASERLIKPQAVLPFRVERSRATELFRAWIASLWFAPSALKQLARLEGRLQGLYTPYWTFDARTMSAYRGQRGDDYQVRRTRTVRRNGRTVTESYLETETRWTPVAGRVYRDFDDVLVVGSRSLPRDLAEELEPWDLEALAPYAAEYLSGFLAERYRVGLGEGWQRAGERMDDLIRRDVRRDIGGDHQRITSLRTDHEDVTFKHVLLPLWICSYQYGERVYRFLVNARTGEVQGQRPWSGVKITLAALAAILVAIAIWWLTR